jgi:hypothetical protein
MKTKAIRILQGLGIVLLAVVLGVLALRPFYLNWGATAEDRGRAMPGDLSGTRWTRAIIIGATPEQIWPWLVQFGQGRGGWYSYDWLENLLGFDIHTAPGIVPEYQNPQIGEKICMSATFCVSAVSVMEPHQWFGWQARDDTGKPIWSFTFGLFPLDSTHTRLVVRESFDPIDMPVAATTALEIPDAVMVQKMLSTLKERAEGRMGSPLTTVYEIAVWLAACAIGVLAAVLFVARRAGKKALAVGALAAGVVAVLVLLALTLVFPPYWLRGVLVIALLGGLAWSWRQTAKA